MEYDPAQPSTETEMSMAYGNAGLVVHAGVDVTSTSELGAAGVRAAVILSAGFGESSDAGALLEKEILEHARLYDMRIVGPNCLGILRPQSGLNASFSNSNVLPGRMAFVSQSGALCTAILDWAQSSAIGFSAIVSLGDAVDVDFGDVLSYLAMDPQTGSILLYVEGIHNE